GRQRQGRGGENSGGQEGRGRSGKQGSPGTGDRKSKEGHHRRAAGLDRTIPEGGGGGVGERSHAVGHGHAVFRHAEVHRRERQNQYVVSVSLAGVCQGCLRSDSAGHGGGGERDRKSTRLNSSHQIISYAVFCLKKKKQTKIKETRKNTKKETKT